MNNWQHPKNDGWREVQYDLGLEGENATNLSFLLNQACHVYHCHGEGIWKSDDKDSYAQLVLDYITRFPQLESRLLRTGDRVIKMLVYRAITLRHIECHSL